MRKGSMLSGMVKLVIICGILAALYSCYVFHMAERKKQLEIATQEVATIMEKTEFSINIPVHAKFSPKGGGYSIAGIEGVRVTAYNNLPEQTNDQPNIGASNRKVYEGSIAVSRDLLKMYNIRYGDIVCLEKNNTCYLVEDTMNKRYNDLVTPGSGKRMDIFLYSKPEALKVNFVSNAIVIKQR